MQDQMFASHIYVLADIWMLTLRQSRNLKYVLLHDMSYKHTSDIIYTHF